MKLAELSAQYAEAERLLAGRIRQLRREERQCRQPEQRWRLHRRLLALYTMRTQTRQLAELTARYYERGYCRNEKYTL